MNDKIWYMIMALCLVCLLAGSASALSITTDKQALKSGENITANVSEMTNGTTFHMKVTIDQQITSAGNVSGDFNVTIPFKISGGNFTLSEMNTTENSVTIGENEIQPGEIQGEGLYHEMTWSGSSVNGLFSRTNTSSEIAEGTMNVRWVVTPMPGAKIVTSVVEINGTKVAGPDNFVLNTRSNSINPSTINVEILANDTVAYQSPFILETAVIPTLMPGDNSPGSNSPGSNSASGSDAYTGETGAVKPAVNNTTANLTASMTTVAGITPLVAMTTEVPSTGMNATGASMDVAGAATNGTTPKPAGAPFALVTLIGLGLACLVVRSRR